MLRKWPCKSQVVPYLYLICSQEGCDKPLLAAKCGVDNRYFEKEFEKIRVFLSLLKRWIILKNPLKNPEIDYIFRSNSQKIEARVSTSIDDITSAEEHQEIKSHLQLSPPLMYDFVSLVFSLGGV